MILSMKVFGLFSSIFLTFSFENAKLDLDGFNIPIPLSFTRKWTKIWRKTFSETWKPFKDISHFCYITHSMSPLKNRVSNSLTLLFTHKLHLAVHILHKYSGNKRTTNKRWWHEKILYQVTVSARVSGTSIAAVFLGRRSPGAGSCDLFRCSLSTMCVMLDDPQLGRLFFCFISM